ncbi:30S ribosomal protein S12 methylthiotransferase RimO [bacterium]|nr:30S ribosomal protein S12 methylthiotransferase RimO [bacterium]
MSAVRKCINQNKDPRVCFISLGCPKNQVDSETAMALFRDLGMVLTEDPNTADALVVNTCAFIQSAEEETIQAVLEAAQLKKRKKVSVLMVVGCWITKHGAEKIKKMIPEIDCMGLPGDVTKWAEQLEQFLPGLPVQEKKTATPSMRLLLSGPGTAYLKIAEGCSRKCAFCLIPALRGKLHSREIPEIVMEAKQLVRQGVLELVLVAQDTTSYGQDLKNGTTLSKLLDRLVRIAGIRWIRIMYTNPDGITEALIRRIAREKKICNYLDMPVQHAQAGILKAMKRTGDAETLLKLIGRLRKRIPGLVIRTTILSGFPGETEQDHQVLLDFISRARFNRLGVFSYSKEAGTTAAKMKQQVSLAVRNRRRKEIMERQAGVSLEQLEGAIGKKFDCLVEERSGKKHCIGRTIFDAPEIDGGIILTGNIRPGTIVKVRVTGATDHDLIGVLA